MTTSELVIALASILAPLLTALVVFMYKQSVKLGVIENRSKELEHNGGGSLKDYAKGSMNEAASARSIAQDALTRVINMEANMADVSHELSEHRRRREYESGAQTSAMGQLQHDMTNVRIVTNYLHESLQRTDEDRRRKEQAWTDALTKQGIDVPGGAQVKTDE